MTRKGKIQKRALLLLLAGLSLAMSRSAKHHFRVLREVQKEWKEIDRQSLEKAVEALYKSKLIEQKDNKDGTTTFVLSAEGKETALTYNLENMTIARHSWDKKWRIVTFDIPEKLKKVREALRFHLKKLGFIKLQHSVFILPFKCQSEIEYLIEFYNIRKFVRFIEASFIDNELDLKNKFDLL
ncbi:MAG: CRISPR-associated endonuclease Cas2 [Candidatus Zambryskibacteria bacterium]|nr:CRISPR-associated endonuclease Cas2 [Candidatus Zambryskibacteria bacterium]